MKVQRIARWGVSLSIAAAVAMLSASSASADIGKCQKKLDGLALKLMICKIKAFEKCADSIRAAGIKGVPVAAKAAPGCEKSLFKVYNLGGAAPGGCVFKFTSAVQALNSATGGPCTSADLQQLGHLVSGTNAPGVGLDWITTWLYKAKEKLAIKEIYFAIGDFRTLVDSAINAGPDAPSGALGTWCGPGPAPVGYVARPNLCSLNPIFWPQCHDHACTLSAASGAVLNPTGAPVGLSGRRLPIEVCRLTNLPTLPITGPNYDILIGEPAKTFEPPPVIPIVPAITACVEQIRAEGWCDCTGHGVKFQPTFCEDHVGTTPGPNDDCGSPITAATLESNCGCAAIAGPVPVDPNTNPCKTTANCIQCVNKSSGAPCHSGTSNGPVVASWGGASAAKDCVDVNTIQFKLLPPALCITSMGSAAGTCNAPGSPPAGCVAVGGVICVSAAGPDGVPCNSDDLLPASAPVIVPFTTGTSTSTVQDSPQPVQGACGGTTTTANMNCVTAADCGGTAPTCSATLVPITFAAGPGAGISCANMEASNLATWKVVGSFPALDGAGGIGDSVFTFTLACQ